MRVTLRRRKNDRTKFVQSRVGSIPTDYARREELVEIVHVEIPDEDAKPPRSAVTIAKNVAREARRAGILAKTSEPGRTRTLRLRDWPDTCSGLGIGPPFEGPRVVMPSASAHFEPAFKVSAEIASGGPGVVPGRVQEPRSGPVYEKGGPCPSCGGELVQAVLGNVRGRFYCRVDCDAWNEAADRVSAEIASGGLDASPELPSPVDVVVDVLEVNLKDSKRAVEALGRSLEVLVDALDELKKSLSTSRS